MLTLPVKSFLLDLLFPTRCAACGRVDTDWCPACARDLADLPLDPHDAADIVSTGAHSGLLQSAVQGLKYHGVRALAEPLGARVAAAVARLRPAMVVPVPASAARIRSRGYNQAALIAAACARSLGVPAEPLALIRLRETRSQVGLTRLERLENVVGAFAADPARVTGAAVLLVDDVYTTGATLRECLTALRAAGASEARAATVSFALH
jgi:ComF family protein